MTAIEILQNYYAEYEKAREIDEKHIEDGTLSRKEDGLPLRVLNADEVQAVIDLLQQNQRIDEMLRLLKNNVASGTAMPAKIKADFLGKVAVGQIVIENLTPNEAILLLGSMKGGHNIPVLISLLENDKTAPSAVGPLSESVLIHSAFNDVVQLCDIGNKYALGLIEMWARGDWFARRKPLEDETKVIVFKVPDDIEASTDFLSHSKGGHTRTDVPFHAKHYFMNQQLLSELDELKKNNPDIPVAFVADKIGTSSSRKSGMNNVEYNVGIENEDTLYQPNKKTRAIIFAGSVLGPIFAKTAEDMGSIIIRTDTNKVKTGDVLTIRWKTGEILNQSGTTQASFTPLTKSDLDLIKAGGGTNFRMGKILTDNAGKVWGKSFKLPYETKETLDEIRPMTAGQKVIAKAANLKSVKAGQTVYARVDTVASQDTTGGMTVQEIQSTLAAMTLSVPLFLQSQCHNAAMGFRSESVVNANKKLTDFVRYMGGITLNMGDGIIHSWLNELVLPDTIVVGGDSHTRTPTALSFPLGSGGVAEAAVTGVTEITVPDSVLVRISGEFNAGITVRDLVNYIAFKAQKQFGKNVFEGSLMEFQRIGQPFDMIDVFKLTNASAERSAAAAYFEQSPEIIADYIKQSSVPVIKEMIKAGYDNKGVLENRLKAFEEYLKAPAKMTADTGAEYACVLDVDLAEIIEPYVACPHTPDNVKPLSDLTGTKVDFCFLGSCMSGKKDFETFDSITKNVEKIPVETWAATPTRLIAANLDTRGVIKSLSNKGVRIEISGCSLCMGNQERVVGQKNVLSTSTRNFKGRMGDDASVFLLSTELEAVCALKGEFPTKEDYFKAIKND